MRKHLNRGEWPIILTDGWCPKCGSALPLEEYQQLAKAANGLLVVDDSQGLGILGGSPNMKYPYGFGGGGTMKWLGLGRANTIVGASLAKGFGVPISILGGTVEWINDLKQNSKIRVHCSPPDSAILAATKHALALNFREGDLRRQALVRNVRFFKQYLWQIGISSSFGLFPVQTIEGVSGVEAQQWYRRLKENGVRCLLTEGHAKEAKLTFILRCGHQKKELTFVLERLAEIARQLWSREAFGECTKL